MAKRLAIEWDACELRVVAGTLRGNKVTVTDVASIPIDSAEPSVLGEKLQQLLSEHGLEKSVAAIALGRGKAELRELKLPPVPEAELPEMVRFQAVRTFAGAGERAVIDFLSTQQDEEGNRVIAAAVAPEELKNCALVGAPSQLTVQRVVLGPIAAAALYRRSGLAIAGETVLIDLMAADADIVVLRNGTPAFVRSIRMADDPAVRVRTLSGEVRRSLMACREGREDGDVPRRIILWGRADVHKDEVTALTASLKTQVETLDPFSLVDIGGTLRSSMPEHVGRLAPLVGLLEADARGGEDLIDFLNPRRPPEPVSNRGRYVAIGTAVAALVGVVLFLGWQRLNNLDNEIAVLQTEYASLEHPVEAAERSIARTAQVDAFLDGDVFWLDELRRAAVQMPPAEQAIVNALIAKVERNGGSSLAISGGVTDSEAHGELVAALRDESRRVVGEGLKRVSNQEPYNWAFKETIVIAPEFVRQLREAGAAPDGADADGADADAPDGAGPAGGTGDAADSAAGDSPSDRPADAEAPLETDTTEQDTTEEDTTEQGAAPPATEKPQSGESTPAPPPSADDVARSQDTQAEVVQ